MKRFIRTILILAILAFIGYEAFEWTVNRVYVPEGKSLQLRYKGPLIFTWLAKKAEIGQFADEVEGRDGRAGAAPRSGPALLLPDLVGTQPRRRRRGPYGRNRRLNSMLGDESADRKEGQFLVAGDVGHTQQKGILRRVLGPGRYRINPYAYQATIVKTVEERVGNNQVKYSGWVQIPAGYVGVQTYLTDDPQHKQAGRHPGRRPAAGTVCHQPQGTADRHRLHRLQRQGNLHGEAEGRRRKAGCRRERRRRRWPTRALLFLPATDSKSTWTSAWSGE